MSEKFFKFEKPEKSSLEVAPTILSTLSTYDLERPPVTLNFKLEL